MNLCIAECIDSSMAISIDISSLFSYLKSTSNLALSCREFYYKVISNGFPIRTSKAGLCPENVSFYKLLGYPVDEWLTVQIRKAIDVNNLKLLQLLLDNRVWIEAKEAKDIFGHTALSYAVSYNKIDAVKLLLERGADVKAKDLYGATALMFAAANGHLEHLELLLDSGAELEAKNNLGRTALDLAARYDKTDCIKVLLGHGAKVSPQSRQIYPQYSELWGDSTL